MYTKHLYYIHLKNISTSKLMIQLGSSLLEVSNQVITITSLFETGKGHLVARNILLGVLEIVRESIRAPFDSLALHSIRVGETSLGTRGTAEDAMQIRADLVTAAGVSSVTLQATGFKELCALLLISFLESHL